MCKNKSNTKYKVWLHLELIEKDEDGTESETNGDEIILPLPVITTDSLEIAESTMNEIHEKYYTE